MRARVSLAAPVLALLAAGTVAAQQAAVPLEGDPSRRERLDALQGKPAPELEVALDIGGRSGEHLRERGWVEPRLTQQLRVVGLLREVVRDLRAA